MDKISYEPTLLHKYSYTFDFDFSKLSFCRALKDKLGDSEFMYQDKAWHSKELAPMLDIKRRYPSTQLDETVALEMSMILEEERKKIKDSEMIPDYAIEIPELKATLRQYQKNTVGFFLKNGGRGFMCLDPGCGKTVCSLAYALAAKKKRILVVCPNSMKGTWSDEVKKFTNLRPYIFEAGHRPELKDKIKWDDYDIFIINYDIVDRLLSIVRQGKKIISIELNELCKSFNLDLLILDEVTMIKNYIAQRTKKTVALSRYIPSILLLSGTPIINSPKDLFIPLNIINNTRFSNFFKFAFRFCDPIRQAWGIDFSGSSNMEELRDILKPYYVRYSKREVLKDLPPTIFTDMPVSLHPEYKKKYNMALSNLVEYLKQVRKRTDEETKRSMQAEKLVLLNELRQITSMSKVEDAEEVINNIVESGEKVIVFSNFHEPLKNLHETFKDNSVLLLGDSSDKEREEAKNGFQFDDRIKIFFGGTRAAGLGITLNRAENVLFIDQPWTAADYEQAYSRAERMGNVSDVINIRTMYVKGSVDEKIANIIKKKKEIADFIFDNQAGTSIVNEVLGGLVDE